MSFPFLCMLFIEGARRDEIITLFGTHVKSRVVEIISLSTESRWICYPASDIEESSYSMISFVSSAQLQRAHAEASKITPQSIVRDSRCSSCLRFGPAVSIAKKPAAPRSSNYSFRSLTHLANSRRTTIKLSLVYVKPTSIFVDSET